jgi:hypothetical protein
MYVFLLFFFLNFFSIVIFLISLFIVIDFFRYFLNYQWNQWFKSQILLCQNYFFYPACGRAWTTNLVFSITPYLFQTREYI